MQKYIALMRVEQWVKNFFVFLPLFFSGNFLHFHLLLKSVFAFLAFSLASSAVYVINDFKDRHADSAHPEKKNRPIASGAVSPRRALVFFALLLLALFILLVVGTTCLEVSFSDIGLVIFIYLLLNIAYTLELKHVAIIDVTIVSLGFVLRVVAGGASTSIPISQWAILLTFVLAMVLALGKRRGELINSGITGKTRRALDGYNVQFADIALSISVTLAIVSYLMFTVTPEAQLRFGKEIFFTVLFVVFAFLRYLQQTLVYNRTESPTQVAYKDRYIQITVLLWVFSFLLLIYFKK